jgi:phospholipid transport system substrate-binding protein
LFVAAGVFLLAGIFGMGTASAGTAEGKPEAIIRRTVGEAFAILKNKELAGKEHRGERLTKLREVADRTFDWAAMAKASLGAPWRTMDPAKRTRFVDVFKDVLAARYMDDINRFEGTETVSVDGSSRDGDDPIVKTTLVTGSREHVPIDYRMQGAGDRWSIVDISIEGVSLVNHYRKTFSAALVNMTVDQLIDKLNKQLPTASRK